jgi:dipeptidyl aminopeptidase/acylaminoacyl peptidase
MRGLSDDNVLLINYVAILDERQKHGKLFDAMVYPGHGHVIGGKVAAPHGLRSSARFFARHLGGAFE